MHSSQRCTERSSHGLVGAIAADAECMQLDVLALRTSTPRFLLGTGFPPLSVGVGCR